MKTISITKVKGEVFYMKKKWFLIIFLICFVISNVFTASTSDKIVARIDDNIILKSELEQYMMGMGEVTDEEKIKILNEIIGQKLIYLEAREKEEITISDDEIEKKVDQMVKNMRSRLGEKRFNEMINQQGLNINNLRSNYRKRIRENMYIERYVQQEIRPSITISDAEVREFYEENKSQFNIPPKYSYDIVYLPYEVNQSDIKEIKTKLDDIREEILAHNITFKEAAEKYSDGPTASEGGDLGFISKGMLVPEFEKKIFSMDEGAITKPFKTKYGYHIAYLKNIKDDQRRVYHIILQPKPAENKMKSFYSKFMNKYNDGGWDNAKSWGAENNIKFLDFDKAESGEINQMILRRLKKLDESKNISNPFYFNNGIVVVRLRDITDTKKVNYEDIKGRAKRILTSNKIRKKMAEIANRLNDKYYIEIFI